MEIKTQQIYRKTYKSIKNTYVKQIWKNNKQISRFAVQDFEPVGFVTQGAN